jgi:hypothetical protein
MPAKGPTPKRSTQRLGHRTQAERERTQTAVVLAKPGKLYGPPLGIRGAHPLAANWYGGLRRSGQAEFYQDSDWATAQVWAQLLSVALGQDRGGPERRPADRAREHGPRA